MKYCLELLFWLCFILIIIGIILFIGNLIKYKIHCDITKDLAYKWNCDYGYATFEQFTDLISKNVVCDIDAIGNTNINSYKTTIIVSNTIIKLDDKMMIFNLKDFLKYQQWYKNFKCKNNYKENLWD